MKLVLCLFLASFVCLQFVSVTTAADAPNPPTVKPMKSSYQSKQKLSSSEPESEVSITVGDDHGFTYTVNGVTRSEAKIAVAGEYYDDPEQRYGYARLFLIVQGISYYAIRELGDRLDVYVEDFYYNAFYFEVFSPYPVSANDLRVGQYNSSTILVSGPSRSVVYYGKSGGGPPK